MIALTVAWWRMKEMDWPITLRGFANFRWSNWILTIKMKILFFHIESLLNHWFMINSKLILFRREQIKMTISGEKRIMQRTFPEQANVWSWWIDSSDIKDCFSFLKLIGCLKCRALSEAEIILSFLTDLEVPGKTEIKVVIVVKELTTTLILLLFLIYSDLASPA